ncbi:MAG: acyl-CoA thioesterase [Planctomycetota bacterium]|nr:acyl-CoA thioesterase [Planctomycetota bacterium]
MTPMDRVERTSRMPAGVEHPRPILFRWRVEETGLSETVAHVNNVTYLEWVDHVAERAGEVLGHTRRDLAEMNRMWFVARHEIDYLAEAFAGDRLVAATWIHDARRTSCRRATLMWREEPETAAPIARALSTWTWIDLERRRPTRMPDEITRLLDPLVSTPGGGESS